MGHTEDKKILNIQYLRGLSALAVVLCHYGMLLKSHPSIALVSSDGQNGVYSFFMISGFVIIFSLDKYNYTPKSFFKFLLKRSIRIDPPYILILILYLLTFYILNHIPSFKGPEVSFVPEQFISHVLYITPFTKWKFYDHVFWTLCVEFQFYLLIGLGYYLSQNNFYKLTFILVFGASSFIPFHNTNYLIFNYGCVFGTGMSLVNYYKFKCKLNLYLLLICLLMCYMKFGFDVTLILAISGIFILFNNLTSSFLNFLGNISYSLYISHTLILILLKGLANRFFPLNAQNELLLLTLFVFTAIVGAFVYYSLIEKISIKLSKSVSFKQHA